MAHGDLSDLGTLTAEQFHAGHGLRDVNTLPLATLRQLADQGVILSVMSFEDHMNPEVHWIEPEEFGQAFDALIKGEADMPDARADRYFEAAFTASAAYPAYINARRAGPEAGSNARGITITVRSPQIEVGIPTAADPLAQNTRPAPGNLGVITLSLEDLDQWIADLGRLRASFDA